MSERAERLQDAIGEIDDGYIEEANAARGAGEAAAAAVAVAAGAADEARAAKIAPAVEAAASRKRRRWVVPAAAAACLALVVGVGLFALAGPHMSADLALESSDDARDAYVVTDGAPDAPEAAMTGATDSAAGFGYVASEGIASEDFALTAAPAPDASAKMAPEAAAAADGVEEAYVDAYQASPFVLTAGEWNDNANWPFFTNLVNSGAIAFPSFGIDPRHRVRVNVWDVGEPREGVPVSLVDAEGNVLWTAVSDASGVAYLFYESGDEPVGVRSGDEYMSLLAEGEGGEGEPDPQDPAPDPAPAGLLDEVDLQVPLFDGAARMGVQVAFIMDTTGSMADELAYLQADFAQIAADAGEGVEYAVTFYRDEGDEYVVRGGGFTTDVSAVRDSIMAETAAGGGDEPEAVADALVSAIVNEDGWRGDCAKVAFLIFDAPPHEGTEGTLRAAVESAAARGIRLVPVVASNASRDTELFGRALAICTNGTYVFLTDDSGVGDAHLEPIVGDYSVELLHDVIVRIIQNAS